MRIYGRHFNERSRNFLKELITKCPEHRKDIIMAALIVKWDTITDLRDFERIISRHVLDQVNDISIDLLRLQGSKSAKRLRELHEKEINEYARRLQEAIKAYKESFSTSKNKNKSKRRSVNK